MKVALSVATIGLVVLLLYFSTPSVDAQQRELRGLSGFTAIEVSGGIDLEIQQGDSFSLEIRAPENDLANVITRIEGSTLEIRRGRGANGWFGWFSSSPWVMVTLPELESVSASGGSDVMTHSALSGDRLRIAASGGADVYIDAAVTELEVNSSGGSDVHLSGTADSANLRTSGGSDVIAYSLAAREVRVQSSGGSDVMVSVASRLVGSASGGSDVVYRGNPDFVDVNVSGGADLTHQ